jgi:arabinofuranosyltransferase
MRAGLPLGLGLLTLLMRLGAGPFTVDDAYITFRYARNLARGLGLVSGALIV